MGDETPDYLIPRMGERPVSSARQYQTATLTRMLSKEQPLQPLSIPVSVPKQNEVAAGAPAEGVLLMHQQSWVIEGTALGPLAHSVCLAPGEITQIAIRNRTRSVMENSVDVGVQNEFVTSSGRSSTEAQENERIKARESTHGTTAQSSNSTSAEGSTGFIVTASGGTSLTESSQANTNLGSRQVSEQANQAVHQQANNQAARARARSSVSVQEVSESDSLEIKTRVLANYNHMHALTMQYFEVEQVYQLQTRVVDAERLLFVPLKSIDFADKDQTARAIGKYRDHMIGAARDLGLEHVAAKLDAGRFSGANLQEQLKDLNSRIKSLTAVDVSPDEQATATSENDPDIDVDALDSSTTNLTSVTNIDAARKRVDGLRKELDDIEDSVLEARDAMRSLGVSGASRDSDDAQKASLAARGKAQRQLRIATARLQAVKARFSDAEIRLQELLNELEQLRYLKKQSELADQFSGESGEKTLRKVLQANELAINQGIWLRLDSSEVSALMMQLTMNGDRLGDTIDPTPVAVAGNRVAFRWRFRDTEEGRAAADRFAARFVGKRELLHSVSLPTGGIFGEAVLGESNAAEKIDLSRFWNWSDSLPPIRPAEIASLGVTDEAQLRAPSSVEAPNSTINFGDVIFPDSPSRTSAIAQTLSNSEMFRDLSGQEATAALAKTAQQLSAEGASKAGEMAGQNYRRFLKFRQAIGESVLGLGAGKKMNPTLTGGAINAQGGVQGVAAAGSQNPAKTRPTPNVSFTKGGK